jgi:hypothetical protein
MVVAGTHSLPRGLQCESILYVKHSNNRDGIMT